MRKAHLALTAVVAMVAAAVAASALIGGAVAVRSSSVEHGADDASATDSFSGGATGDPRQGGIALPKVASINLCTDQLVLHIADPSQIVSLSWLSTDPEESTLADAAARYPLNYGSAEELLRVDPDVVIAGLYTNAFTRRLLRELGYTVVDIEPASSLADIENHIRQVAAAIGRAERGDSLIRGMQARIARHRQRVHSSPVPAVVVRPGGFTVEAPSLAHELMTLAGLRNLPAERGLDRWGSLSVETLLHHPPDLLVFAAYRRDDASLANAVLAHPALERLAAETVTAEVPAAMWSCGLPSSLDVVALLADAADEARSRTPRLSRAPRAPGERVLR